MIFPKFHPLIPRFAFGTEDAHPPVDQCSCRYVVIPTNMETNYHCLVGFYFSVLGGCYMYPTEIQNYTQRKSITLWSTNIAMKNAPFIAIFLTFYPFKIVFFPVRPYVKLSKDIPPSCGRFTT